MENVLHTLISLIYSSALSNQQAEMKNAQTYAILLLKSLQNILKWSTLTLLHHEKNAITTFPYPPS